MISKKIAKYKKLITLSISLTLLLLIPIKVHGWRGGNHWCCESVALYHCELEVEHSTGNCDCYEGCYAKYIYNCHPPDPGCEDCKEIGDEWEQRNCDTDNCCIKMWAACCDNSKCQTCECSRDRDCPSGYKCDGCYCYEDCSTENRCRYGNQVWRYDTCSGWLHYIETCTGETGECEKNWQCQGNNKIRTQEITTSTCSGGSCTENTTTETCEIYECPYGCSAGNCRPKAVLETDKSIEGELPSGTTIEFNCLKSIEPECGDSESQAREAVHLKTAQTAPATGP